MQLNFTTEVEVLVNRDVFLKSAVGTASITWSLVLNADENSVEDIQIIVNSQKILLKLETPYLNKESFELWEKEYQLNEVEINGFAVSRSGDFIKAIKGGIKPKELELWKNKAILSF